MCELIETTQQFQDLINNNLNTTICIFFYADWCGFSQKGLPIFDEVADKNKETMIFAKVSSYSNFQSKQMTKSMKISGFPTIVMFKNKKYSKFPGYRNGKQLQELVNKNK